MITNYSSFFNYYKIFEAEEQDKALKSAKDFVIKIYKSRLLAIKKAKEKKAKIEKEPDVITDDEMKTFINSIKLSPEEETACATKGIEDTYFIRIREIVKNKPEWIDPFTRLFFTHFTNYKIIANPAEKVDNTELLTMLLGEYNYLTEDDGTHTINWNNSNNYGSIGDNFKNMLAGSNDLQRIILGKFPEIINIEKNKWRAENNSTETRTGSEILSDYIRDLGKQKQIDLLIERLPRGIDGKYDLYDEYKKLPENSDLKNKLNTSVQALLDVLQDKGISIKPTRNSVDGKMKYPYEDIFKIRAGTAADKQLDKTLADFYKRLTDTIKSFSNRNSGELLDEIIKCNKNLGEQDGVCVVYNENNIIVIGIKSHSANRYLHNQEHGKSIKTQHCIAYDSSQYWNANLRSENNIYNRLYYVYNFGIDPTNTLFPFGIIIQPNGEIHSSHDRADNGIKEKVKHIIEKWHIPFSVFAPISKEEKENMELTVNASKVIMETGITIERLVKAIKHGANVNASNGTPLINAVRESNIENIKLLLKSGANPNIGECLQYATSWEIVVLLLENDPPADPNVKKNFLMLKAVEEDELAKVEYLLAHKANPNLESPITKAKSIAMIKLLVGAKPIGAAVTEDTLEFIIRANDYDTLKYVLDHGADAAIKQSISLGFCIKYIQDEAQCIKTLQLLLNNQGRHAEIHGGRNRIFKSAGIRMKFKVLKYILDVLNKCNPAIADEDWYGHICFYITSFDDFVDENIPPLNSAQRKQMTDFIQSYSGYDLSSHFDEE